MGHGEADGFGVTIVPATVSAVAGDCGEVFDIVNFYIDAHMLSFLTAVWRSPATK